MTSLQASRAIVATLAFGFLFGAPGWATAEVLAKETDALPVAQLDPDPAIPTIKETLGYDWAKRITDHASMQLYLQTLATAK